MKMIGTIGIEGLLIDVIIGVLDEERTKQQSLIIDVEAKTDFAKLLQSDDLLATIDYRDIKEICIKVAKRKDFLLLESLAYAILQEIKKKLPILHAKITIRKPQAIQDASCGFVTLEIE